MPAAKKAATAKAVVPKKSRTRTPPYRHHPAWSEARFWSFIRSALRSAWSRYPPKYIVVANARRVSQSANKKLKWEFQCNECKDWFPQKETSVDHIKPAGTLRCYEDLPKFVEQLFVGVDDLQVLCSACHASKTLKERQDKKDNNNNDE